MKRTPVTTDGKTGAMPPDVVVRPLLAADLGAVVDLDHRAMGRSRRGYFERRLEAAKRSPRRHLQLALTTGKGLVGFLLARRGGGEFGRSEEVVVLEAIGVDPSLRRQGLGQRLLEELTTLAKERGVAAISTQVDWHDTTMLRFLADARFTLAPWYLLEREVDRVPLPATDEEIEQWPPLVRHLKQADFDAVVRIDKRITGKDRGEYLRRKFDEVLNESAIEMSLVAEHDGLPVAFAMARVDAGDFGHVEATAQLDTIGVDPGFAHRGFAHAVMAQMVENLSALHVERLETEVPRDGFDLWRFLHAEGFGPSQRLAFVKEI